MIFQLPYVFYGAARLFFLLRRFSPVPTFCLMYIIVFYVNFCNLYPATTIQHSSRNQEFHSLPSQPAHSPRNYRRPFSRTCRVELEESPLMRATRMPMRAVQERAESTMRAPNDMNTIWAKSDKTPSRGQTDEAPVTPPMTNRDENAGDWPRIDRNNGQR